MLRSRATRGAHFGEGTTQDRPARFTPVPQRGERRSPERRQPTGQRGFAAHLLRTPQKASPRSSRGAGACSSGDRGAPCPAPLTWRSPNRSRRKPWGLTLNTAPTGAQLVLTSRARSAAPRPPGRARPGSRADARAARPPSLPVHNIVGRSTRSPRPVRAAHAGLRSPARAGARRLQGSGPAPVT